jgi:hypothetical protein
MKRIVSGLLFLVFLSTQALVGQKFTQRWKIDPGSRPQFPASGDVYRGAAYNPVTDRYLVVSRAIGLKVYVLSASTGALLDSLNVTGITGGTFALNEIEVARDGVIYGANLTIQSGADTVYKIYRWANETAIPTVAFSGRPGTARIGDSFDVAGTGTSTVIYASGNAATSVVQTFRTTDGANFTLGSPINIVGQEAGAGIAQIAPGGNAYVSRFVSGNKVDLINLAGAVVGSVPDTIFGASVADIHYFEVGTRKFLAGAPAGATNHDPARLIDVTAGPDKAVLVDSTADLGNNANVNATGDVDVKVNPDGSIVLFVLVGNNGLAAFVTNRPVSVGSDRNLPTQFVLEQNYPNPFNPTTTIRYHIPQSGRLSLKIFDMLGREVRTLVDGNIEAGSYQASWDGKNESGYDVPSGIYFYQLSTNGGWQTRKMTLVK